MKFLSLLGALIVMTALTACGDKSSSNNNNNAAPTTPLASQYYTINKGLCYDDANIRVDNANCDGLQGYYEVNGYCYTPGNARIGNEYCQRIPSRVRPTCTGKGYYSMRRGKRHNMECNNRGCHGRSVYDHDGRITYCRN